MKSDEMRNGGGMRRTEVRDEETEGRRTEELGDKGGQNFTQKDGEADEQTSFSTSLKFWEDCRQQRL